MFEPSVLAENRIVLGAEEKNFICLPQRETYGAFLVVSPAEGYGDAYFTKAALLRYIQRKASVLCLQNTDLTNLMAYAAEKGYETHYLHTSSAHDYFGVSEKPVFVSVNMNLEQNRQHVMTDELWREFFAWDKEAVIVMQYPEQLGTAYAFLSVLQTSFRDVSCQKALILTIPSMDAMIETFGMKASDIAGNFRAVLHFEQKPPYFDYGGVSFDFRPLHYRSIPICKA